jgi:hypothetical protein
LTALKILKRKENREEKGKKVEVRNETENAYRSVTLISNL